MKGRFATAINCIDGRVQTPVLDWIRLHLNVDYVDLITEPGPDKVLALGTDAAFAILDKVKFSVSVHDPVALAIAGHNDCLANPAPRDVHLDQIRKAVANIHSLSAGIRVIGLWVNEWGWVDLIVDTEQSHEAISYQQYSV
jgi:hypothetical protein